MGSRGGRQGLQTRVATAVIRLVLWLRPKLNALLVPVFRRRAIPRSVLHVSYMVHIPYYTVRLLRQQGYRADYLAIGRSATWDKADFCYEPSRWPSLYALKEWWWFWTRMARYQTIHFHFMITLSYEGWELAVLQALGRRIVVHFRGCEVRDRETNMRLHPDVNICQDCDYEPRVCELPVNAVRRRLARQYADLTLVTTPDLKEFLPQAIHFPFFAPHDGLKPSATGPHWPDRRTFRIVHATNHPGIEGTKAIQSVIDRLKGRGYPIEFIFLKGVSYETVLGAYADADLAIGKMKMGYYANGQIESLWCGVPTITSVRPEFRTPEIEKSGFILATLETLEYVVAHYIDHPEELADKRRLARESVLRLHDNKALTQRLIGLYEGMAERTQRT